MLLQDFLDVSSEVQLISPIVLTICVVYVTDYKIALFICAATLFSSMYTFASQLERIPTTRARGI